MSDVLSQEEIDKLLMSISSGEPQAIEIEPADEKKISVYNFTKPSKFNKEQLKTLEIIFESFGRDVASFLTGYLRTPVTIQISDSEQVSYAEFANSLLNPVILSIIDFSPFKGSIIAELSSNLGYSIIDRVLGGTGNYKGDTSEFTEIETRLITKVMEQIISFLGEPWSSVCEVTPKVERVETNSQFAQVIDPTEMIALITTKINIGDTEGTMNFCIPHLVIEPIVADLNTKNWFSQRQEDAQIEYRSTVEKQLEDTFIPISVLIGKTNITVDEFINIQVGDVIPLDSYITSDLRVNVENKTKFYAKPGISKGKNAIQITSIIGKEENNE